MSHGKRLPLDARAGVPVDAHVRFHRIELVSSTLSAAAENFAVCRRDHPLLSGMLLLVEPE